MNNGGMMNCRSCRDDCEKLIRRVQELDFALIEVGLYLDMYPDCEVALEYRRRLSEARCEAVEKYERACGPLTITGEMRNGWSWVKTPWPWEISFTTDNGG